MAISNANWNTILAGQYNPLPVGPTAMNFQGQRIAGNAANVGATAQNWTQNILPNQFNPLPAGPTNMQFAARSLASGAYRPAAAVNTAGSGSYGAIAAGNDRTGWTIDNYRNAGSSSPTVTRSPQASPGPVASSVNSRAAYTPRPSTGIAAGSKSYNRPASTLNGYGMAQQAVGYGSYAGGGMTMGAPVVGLSAYNSMGQQVNQGGGGGMYGGLQGRYARTADGGYDVTKPLSGQAAPRVSQAQAFFNDVQNQANAAKAANEQRYDAILNRDQASITPDFLSWLKEQNPRAAKDVNLLNRLVADPKMQEQYRSTDRFASFGGYRDRYTRGMGNQDQIVSTLAGYGQQQLADNIENWQKANNRAQMSLAKKGLLGSTVGSSVAANMQKESGKDARRIQEDMQLRQATALQNRANADAQLSGDTLRFMENRNDTYPDQLALADLALKLGLSGGGGGGGGFGGGGTMPLQYTGTYSRNGMPARSFGQPSYRGF